MSHGECFGPASCSAPCLPDQCLPDRCPQTHKHRRSTWRGAALLLKTDGGNVALEAQRCRGFHTAAAAPCAAAGSERPGRGLSGEEQEAANATGAATEGKQEQAGDAATMVRAQWAEGEQQRSVVSRRRLPPHAPADLLPLSHALLRSCLQSYTSERGAETPPEAAGDTGDMPDQSGGGMRNVQAKERGGTGGGSMLLTALASQKPG